MLNDYLGERTCAFVIARGTSSRQVSELKNVFKETWYKRYKIQIEWIYESFPQQRSENVQVQKDTT